MKKLLCILFSMAVFSSIASYALTFDQAIQQSKPVAVFIYAPWADDVSKLNDAYNAMSVKYGQYYNFTKINIATKEAKEFNKTNAIMQNLPYVLLYRNNGKVMRQLKADCILDNSCFADKLNTFIQR